MNDYQKFIAVSRYSRWLEDKKRRETWDEVVARYFNFMSLHLKTKFDYTLSDELRTELSEAVRNLEVMPSMRALMSAGPALERCNVAGYNCAYLPVDSPRAFDETMYILMCGTGVGFSVERQYVNQLPIVNEHFERSETVIHVGDSKAGWARAFRELLSLLYSGQEPSWDLSNLRPAGARLKTFGGRSSGPEPLDSLFKFAVRTFRDAAGRRLTSLECHDLMCKIGEIVVVGGVRRSALISLSNLSDERMRDAKTGDWWGPDDRPGPRHRSLANNSVCYTERPDLGVFIKEWLSLFKSGSGERGIFSRPASQKQAARNGRRDSTVDFGTNPCSEIILRPYQFCNLSEVVVRADDREDDLKRKVRLATILGTFQSSLSDFKYLRKIWQKNTEEERLLGVSLTGIMDNNWLRWAPDGFLESLKNHAVAVNKEFAETLGISPSCAITCVKPSGTVSQLVDSASGIHPRWAPYYLRTVLGDNNDPLVQLLKDGGIPNEPSKKDPDKVTAFMFPQKAPEHAASRNKLTAIEHLCLWKRIQTEWCEHKPSITVNIRPDEWLEVADWVWKNFDDISGIAFMPHDDHTYVQAPYQEITEAEYEEWTKKMPPAGIPWERLSEYELEDHTTGSQEMACTGGVCEIVDIGVK